MIEQNTKLTKHNLKMNISYYHKIFLKHYLRFLMAVDEPVAPIVSALDQADEHEAERLMAQWSRFNTISDVLTTCRK